jgi:hypothetical protein
MVDDENPVPRYLFRYLAFQDEYNSLRKILLNNEWYFNSRTNFDDQDDCRLPGLLVDRGHLREMMAKNAGGLTQAREREIEQFLADPDAATRTTAEIQSYVNNVGILCISELGNHPALWRAYADDGRGVCLYLETLKIAYDDHYLDRGPFDLIYSDTPKQPWDPRGDQLTQTEVHLLQKATRWQYQKEWRFLMYDDANRTVGYHPMPLDALRGVILGPRLTLSERREVCTWINRRAV